MRVMVLYKGYSHGMSAIKISGAPISCDMHVVWLQQAIAKCKNATLMTIDVAKSQIRRSLVRQNRTQYFWIGKILADRRSRTKRGRPRIAYQSGYFDKTHNGVKAGACFKI